MILAVYGSEDDTARQLVTGLRVRGHPVETVLINQLVFARSWALTVDGCRTTWQVTLADGRVIESSALHGLLNRATPEPSASYWPTASPQDANYAAGEWRAFLLAALDAVPGPHINPCTAGALTGPFWHPAEWRERAQAAGLQIAPEAHELAESTASWSAIVVGNQVFGELDSATQCLCVALSRSLNCVFKEIFFDEHGRAMGGTCLPKVLDSDEGVLDALGELFSQ